MSVENLTQPEMAIDLDATSVPDQQEAPDDLALARALIMRAHPETVHELIVGQTLTELLESVPAAEAAYARIAEAARAATSPVPPDASATVPGGGAVRSASVNLDGLGPFAKIRAVLNRP